jgi:hypothetical protein
MTKRDRKFIQIHSLIGRFVYDSVTRANVKTGEFTLWRAGDNIQVQEPAFIPRSVDCEDGDGYLIVFLSHFDTMLSSLAILDTADLAAGPVARILLPFRLKSGIHGSWVNEFVTFLIVGSWFRNDGRAAVRYERHRSRNQRFRQSPRETELAERRGAIEWRTEDCGSRYPQGSSWYCKWPCWDCEMGNWEATSRTFSYPFTLIFRVFKL